jgi:hypothetical protein
MDITRYNSEASGDSAPTYRQDSDGYVVPPTIVVDEPAEPAGKKRAGYTRNKGKGMTKAKHRMVKASRRANWRHGRS